MTPYTFDNTLLINLEDVESIEIQTTTSVESNPALGLELEDEEFVLVITMKTGNQHWVSISDETEGKDTILDIYRVIRNRL